MNRYKCVQFQRTTVDGEQCSAKFSADHFAASAEDYYCHRHTEQVAEVGP